MEKIICLLFTAFVLSAGCGVSNKEEKLPEEKQMAASSPAIQTQDQVAVSQQPPVRSNTVPPTPVSVQFDLSRSFRLVAFDTYAKIATANEGKSFVFSPHSVAQQLALFLMASEGTAKENIQRLFKIPATPPVLSPFLKQELNQVNSLWNFSSIWVQTGRPVFEEYAMNARDGFSTQIFSNDFTGNKKDALQLINTWGNDNTGGKVSEIFDDYPEGTTLLSAEIVMHKVNWQTPFHMEKTADREFMSLSSEKSTKQMLHKTGTFGFLETENIQLIVFPYLEKHLRLVILKPKSVDKFKEIEKLLSGDSLLALFNQVKQMPLQISIPRVALDCSVDLKSIFPELVIKTELTGMSPSSSAGDPLILPGPIVIKTVFKLEEQGVAPVPPPQEPNVTENANIVSFTADQPFFLIVWNTQTMTPLLLGRIVD